MTRESCLNGRVNGVGSFSEGFTLGGKWAESEGEGERERDSGGRRGEGQKREPLSIVSELCIQKVCR